VASKRRGGGAQRHAPQTNKNKHLPARTRARRSAPLIHKDHQPMAKFKSRYVADESCQVLQEVGERLTLNTHLQIAVKRNITVSLRKITRRHEIV
jgi:hypothetical protein